MNTKNRTIVIDLSGHPQADLAPTLLGAARGINAPAYWGTNAVLVALSPAIAAHREFEDEVRSTGLPVHLRQ